MNTNADIYREMIKTVAKVLAGISLSVGSFISIVILIALGVPGAAVRVGGYDVVVSSTLVFVAIALAFTFLFLSCLILTLLFPLVDIENDATSN